MHGSTQGVRTHHDEEEEVDAAVCVLVLVGLAQQLGKQVEEGVRDERPGGLEDEQRVEVARGEAADGHERGQLDGQDAADHRHDLLVNVGEWDRKRGAEASDDLVERDEDLELGPRALEHDCRLLALRARLGPHGRCFAPQRAAPLLGNKADERGERDQDDGDDERRKAEGDVALALGAERIVLVAVVAVEARAAEDARVPSGA